MKKKDEAIKIIENLKKAYPDATCSLDFETPFQMLIAVMLSAQCTDERVNKTTPELFEKYGTVETMANADIKEIERIIHPCGFYKNKSKNAINAAKTILEMFNRRGSKNNGRFSYNSRSWKKKRKCNYARSI